MIAIIERYGLNERVTKLIFKIKNASAGKVLSIYMVIHSLAATFSVRLGGHIQFIRPLIYPMSEAAGSKYKQASLDEKEVEELKGLASAVENYDIFCLKYLSRF